MQPLTASATNSPAEAQTFDTCRVCLALKPLDDFVTSCGLRKNWCKMCKNSYQRKWHRADPAKRRGYKLLYTYGLTQEDFDALLAAQGGTCAICQSADPFHKKGFHVDHCHTTGVVRGVLCAGCNTGIGGMRDNVATLARAIDYLQLHAPAH